MASTSNLEPQAFGLITFKTTFGDIDIELFTKQCPKLTRQFVQYCLNGIYQGIPFYRVEKDFIAVAGNPEASPIHHDFCPDEFNSRLRFNRRGLLATANLKKDENGSEIFFTLGATPELQNKHSIFGRVLGNSIFNLVELNECQVDDDLKPCSERKITKVIVIDNPYPDLIPVIDRSTTSPKHIEDSSSDLDDPLLRPKLTGKNSKKLSFYPTDDEEDEDESKDEVGATSYKGNGSKVSNESQSSIITDERATLETISATKILEDEEVCLSKQESDKEKEILVEKKPDEKEQRLREIRAQILSIKTQIEQEAETKTLSERRKETTSTEFHTSSSSHREISAYSHKESKKSRHRSYETIEMVTNFKKRLREASNEGTDSRKSCDEISEGELEMDELSTLEKMDSNQWLKHRFEPKDDIIIAKDANSKDNSWYSVDDPRSSMNRRHSSRSHRDHSRHKSSRHRT